MYLRNEKLIEIFNRLKCTKLAKLFADSNSKFYNIIQSMVSDDGLLSIITFLDMVTDIYSRFEDLSRRITLLNKSARKQFLKKDNKDIPSPVFLKKSTYENAQDNNLMYVGGKRQPAKRKPAAKRKPVAKRKPASKKKVRKIHKGPQGGRYYITKGRKVYI